jgi:hypothetical protein
MKALLFIIPAASLLLCGCSDSSKSSGTAGENPLNAPTDYLGAAAKAHKSAVKTLGAVSLDSAIKTFAEQENRYPKTLDELVTSGVLPKLPTPPNGMKFDYEAATGKVKVVPAQ